MKLWEIPLVSLLLPYMVNTGQVLGLRFMKTLFEILHFEARYHSIPIVYMSHPEDMYRWRETPARPPFQWRALLPSKNQGFRIRRSLYERDPKKLTELSRSLLAHMLAAPSDQGARPLKHLLRGFPGKGQ